MYLSHTRVTYNVDKIYYKVSIFYNIVYAEKSRHSRLWLLSVSVISIWNACIFP